MMTKMQERVFAQPQAARQSEFSRSSIMTNMQDSIFAQPQAARQGKAQGCAL
jgi:hypothetical protein